MSRYAHVCDCTLAESVAVLAERDGRFRGEPRDGDPTHVGIYELSGDYLAKWIAEGRPTYEPPTLLPAAFDEDI